MDKFSPEELSRCFDALAHLETNYPGFKDWYWQKVVPGIELGTRFLKIKKDKEEIAGIVIAKHKPGGEKKICTLWVAPRHRNKGIGIRLMLAAMEWLNDSHPALSISEIKINEFSKLIDRFGFTATGTTTNASTGLVEYHFNKEPDNDND